MRTITLTSKNQITLPAELVRQLKLDRTRKLQIQKRGETLVIAPQKSLSEQLKDIHRATKPYVKRSLSSTQLNQARANVVIAPR